MKCLKVDNVVKVGDEDKMIAFYRKCLSYPRLIALRPLRNTGGSSVLLLEKEVHL
jgi:hypothetical protein